MTEELFHLPKRLPTILATHLISAITTILGVEVTNTQKLNEELDFHDLNQEVAYNEWVLSEDEEGYPNLRVILDWRDSGIFIYHNNTFQLPLPVVRQIHGLCREYDGILSWIINTDEVEDGEGICESCADTTTDEAGAKPKTAHILH